MHPRKRLQGIIDECQQMINDAMWWNDNRQEKPPLDCEQEQVMLAMAKDAAHYWDAGYIDEAKARMTRLTEYAEACETGRPLNE